MKDKIFMILLGIIAVNLTIQTVKDVGVFPTAFAQDDLIQKVEICSVTGVYVNCANVIENDLKVYDGYVRREIDRILRILTEND